jgi:hypothetical protein
VVRQHLGAHDLGAAPDTAVLHVHAEGPEGPGYVLWHAVNLARARLVLRP